MRRTQKNQITYYLGVDTWTLQINKTERTVPMPTARYCDLNAANLLGNNHCF